MSASILLPSVIHHLHVMLGHPAYSTMLKNFRIYYHNPAAQHLIKNMWNLVPLALWRQNMI
jgi:hypothetical protein